MSLKHPTTKMSKSHEDPRSRILISDSTEEIKTKVRLAMTDSILGISYEPATRPGVSNLLSIMGYLDEEKRSPSDLATTYKTLTIRQFKEEVCKSVEMEISKIRDTYNRLMRSDKREFLDDTARKGAIIANKEADGTMAHVRKAIGLS